MNCSVSDPRPRLCHQPHHHQWISDSERTLATRQRGRERSGRWGWRGLWPPWHMYCLLLWSAGLVLAWPMRTATQGALSDSWSGWFSLVPNAALWDDAGFTYVLSQKRLSLTQPNLSPSPSTQGHKDVGPPRNNRSLCRKIGQSHIKDWKGDQHLQKREWNIYI